MRQVRKHIVHCSDSPSGDVLAIRQWHLARGWQDVGYHYIIRQDGEIEVGRTLDVIGAHCAGHNTDSVGTCLVGRNDFNSRQLASLRRIHAMLKSMFAGLTLHGHRKFNPGKTCPNMDVHKLLEEE